MISPLMWRRTERESRFSRKKFILRTQQQRLFTDSFDRFTCEYGCEKKEEDEGEDGAYYFFGPIGKSKQTKKRDASAVYTKGRKQETKLRCVTTAFSFPDPCLKMEDNQDSPSPHVPSS